jgi:two-component system sensor histidine kinase/response regulator
MWVLVTTPMLAAATSAADSGIDPEVLLDIFDGEAELLREFARHFLDEWPRRLFELRSAVTRHDGKTLERAAHSLKGSGGFLGATVLCDAAQRLEGMARTDEWSACDDALAELAVALERLAPVLSRLAREAR